jgi:hypothetical protein
MSSSGKDVSTVALRFLTGNGPSLVPTIDGDSMFATLAEGAQTLIVGWA